MSRLVVHDEAEHRLGRSGPQPGRGAFLLAMVTLPGALLAGDAEAHDRLHGAGGVADGRRAAGRSRLDRDEPAAGRDAHRRRSARLGSGWFVALAFAVLGLLALSRGRRDLALLLALGTLAFPMEWALKYFVSPEAISLQHAGERDLRRRTGSASTTSRTSRPGTRCARPSSTALIAFCIARLAHDVRQGYTAYVVAAIVVGAISATRIYLGAHYPIDVLGGWMAGGSLLAILVAIHVLRVDEAARAGRVPSRRGRPRRVAVPLTRSLGDRHRCHGGTVERG